MENEERIAALLREWMDRTSELQAKVEMLSVISAVLARHATPEAQGVLRTALGGLQKTGEQRSWTNGTALEQEVARFLKALG